MEHVGEGEGEEVSMQNPNESQGLRSSVAPSPQPPLVKRLRQQDTVGANATTGSKGPTNERSPKSGPETANGANGEKREEGDQVDEPPNKSERVVLVGAPMLVSLNLLLSLPQKDMTLFELGSMRARHVLQIEMGGDLGDNEAVVSQSVLSLRYPQPLLRQSRGQSRGQESSLRRDGLWLVEPHVNYTMRRDQHMFDEDTVHQTIRMLLDGHLLVADASFTSGFIPSHYTNCTVSASLAVDRYKAVGLRTDKDGRDDNVKFFDLFAAALCAVEDVDNDEDAWKAGSYNHIVRAGEWCVLRRSKAHIVWHDETKDKYSNRSERNNASKFCPRCAVHVEELAYGSRWVSGAQSQKLSELSNLLFRLFEHTDTEKIVHVQTATADIITHAILANAGVCPPLLAAGIVQDGIGYKMASLRKKSRDEGTSPVPIKCPFPCCQETFVSPSMASTPLFRQVQLMPMAGETLRSVLNSPQISIREVMTIWDAVWWLINRIADAGFVHLDMHSQNILIERGPSVNPYLPTRDKSCTHRAWAIDMASSDVLCLPTVDRNVCVTLMTMLVGRYFLRFTNQWNRCAGEADRTEPLPKAKAWLEAPWVRPFRRILTDDLRLVKVDPLPSVEFKHLSMCGLHSLLANEWPFGGIARSHHQLDKLVTLVQAFATHHLIKLAINRTRDGNKSDMTQMWEDAMNDLMFFVSDASSDTFSHFTEEVCEAFRMGRRAPSRTGNLRSAHSSFDMIIRRYIIRTQGFLSVFDDAPNPVCALDVASTPCVLQFAAALAINSARATIEEDSTKEPMHKRPCVEKER